MKTTRCESRREIDHRNNRSNRNDVRFENLIILPMYSGLPFNDQLTVFERCKRGLRKVIFSTNIAETSITIDGITTVIDWMFVKIPWNVPINCYISFTCN